MSDTATPERAARKALHAVRRRYAGALASRGRATGPQLPGWTLSGDGKKISRSWTVKNFMAGIDFFNKVAALAEDEGHHPDLHLEGYRNLSIAIWTHAAGGLTENDFILAAKIDQIPVKLR